MKNLIVCNASEGFVIIAQISKLTYSGEHQDYVVLQPTEWKRFWDAWNSKHKQGIRDAGIIPKKQKDKDNNDYWEVRIPKSLYYQ